MDEIAFNQSNASSTQYTPGRKKKRGIQVFSGLK